MIAVIIGFVAGILAGMGLGGGSLLIPALTLFLNIGQKTAQAANIIGFIPAAFISILIHKKNKLIKLKTVFIIAIFGMITAYFSSRMAISLKDTILQKIFAIFLIIAGMFEICKKRE